VVASIVLDTDLFVGIRKESLNVYWRGASLLKIEMVGGVLIGEIHYKYLLVPSTPKSYIQVHDGTAALPEDVASLFNTDLSNLSAMKHAANPYVGEEKLGVHQVVMSNCNIIDVEVALGPETSDEEDKSAQRIDFVALRSTNDGAEVVFYEAKCFMNRRELRAKGGDAPVVNQIRGYQRTINQHTSELVSSYRSICGNLIALHGVRDRYAPCLDLVRRVSSGEAPLSVGRGVRLALFGFDADQREGSAWKPHHEKLRAELGNRLLMKGQANGFRRGISVGPGLLRAGDDEQVRKTSNGDTE
jgi:hypothetical protein